MSVTGTSRTSEDVRLESANWAEADIDHVAVTNRDFMSTRPSTTLADLLTPLLRVDPGSAVRTSPRA
jgi:hypothetical protein